MALGCPPRFEVRAPIVVRGPDSAKLAMTRILVIHGHPSEEGFTARLAQAYLDGAAGAGHEVEALWLGRLFWKKGDQGLIDRFGPDGLTGLVAESSVLARRAQTGLVYSYALVMLLGVAAFATWFMVR